jgi:O-antigen ligase
LVLGLSLFPPSSTRIEIWPWAAFASAGWLIPIVITLLRLAQGRPHARFGGLLDSGLGLLALTALVSAFVSPLRNAVLPHLLPVLGSCALPFALLPALQPIDATRIWRVIGLLLGVIIVTSLLLWVQPCTSLTWPDWRNAQPFGHANITGSVAVLAATWLAAGAVRETDRVRWLFATGTVLAVVTAISSESRGAVLALAAAGATAAAISLLRRGRLLIFVLLVGMIAAVSVGSNARLRDLVMHGHWSAGTRESNDQRTAMFLGGVELGIERPLLGWGAGSVPHVFPRVRAAFLGTADNFLQLHNTPVQLWATLGALGLVSGLLIVAGLISRFKTAPWTPERIALASGLAGAATVLMFDHPFATPVFALLTAAHLAAWARPSALPSTPKSRLVAWITLPLLVPVLIAAGRDLAARSAYDDALGHAESNDPTGYAASLQQAINDAPGDPYYAHQLAAFFVTGHPLHDVRPAPPSAAIALLERTLTANPDLEYAHYNLGWLLLDSDPKASAEHFLKTARLAPQRGAVYIGLGLARIRLQDTNGAVRAFATEWLLDPSCAWSPLWSQPPLDALLPRIRALATEAAHARRVDPWTDLATPATSGPPYRRLRTGYGVLMGHPEGPPPVDFNIQTRMILPEPLATRVPPFGWISGRDLLDFLETD